jgi:ankyrin repeat protein
VIGVDVQARDIHGKTSLMYAAGEGHEALTAALLNAHVDVNAKDVKGRVYHYYLIFRFPTT